MLGNLLVKPPAVSPSVEAPLNGENALLKVLFNYSAESLMKMPYRWKFYLVYLMKVLGKYPAESFIQLFCWTFDENALPLKVLFSLFDESLRKMPCWKFYSVHFSPRSMHLKVNCDMAGLSVLFIFSKRFWPLWSRLDWWQEQGAEE